MSPSSPRVGDLLELRDARVVLEQVADHQRAAGLARGVDGPLGVRDGLRERLLDEAVLAGAQHLLGERARGSGPASRGRPRRAPGRRAGRQVAGPARGRDRRADPLQRGGVAVAQPGELAAGDRREVAREVRAPVAQPRHADRDRRHSAHPTSERRDDPAPRLPVAVERRPLGRRRALQRGDGGGRVEADEHVPARLHGLRPLRRRRAASRTGRRPGRPPSGRRRSRSARARALRSSAVKSR